MTDRGLSESAVLVARTLSNDTGSLETDDLVVCEVPVALSFNSVSYAVMMATPADLEDFIRGFAIGEGIVSTPSAIYDIEITQAANGIDVNASVSNETAYKLKDRRRSMAGPSGCGLCGIESIEQLRRDVKPVTPDRGDRLVPSEKALNRALAGLRPLQDVSRKTGGAHAAAWCSADGDILALREDVGRHNALDKILGWRALNSTEGFVLVSSRASFEMVSKAAAAGVTVLVAVSAPTSAAVDTAKQAGLCLIAFATEGRSARYA